MLGSTRKPQESDYKVPNSPTDCISSLSVNGNAQTPPNCLIATAWDGTVNCYQVQYNGAAIGAVTPQAQMKHDTPVLCSDFSTVDNVTVFSGSSDGVLKMWNVTQGAAGAQQIGKHDAAIKNVRFLHDKNMVVTSSWDKTIKAWDMRSPNPVGTFPLTERPFCMDANSKSLVCGTADRKIHVFDLTAGNKVAEYLSPLQYQPRGLSIFSDNLGFAIGSTEGRIAIEYFDEMQSKINPNNNALTSSMNKPTTKSFPFKCHRDTAKSNFTGDIFPVNAIRFHPKNTFASCGGDGVISIWDKVSRHRVAYFDMFQKKTTISDVVFDKTGNLMFYAASYDWSRGMQGYDPNAKHDIYIHVLQNSETDHKVPAK